MELLTMPLVGIIYLILFAIVNRFPPRERNNLYGYRSPRAMRNDKNWEFAQSYSNSKLFEAGIFLILLSILQAFYPADEAWMNISIQVGLILFSTAYIIYSTEMGLKAFEEEQSTTHQEES